MVVVEAHVAFQRASIVIVNSRFLQRPQKRSRGNQLTATEHRSAYVIICYARLCQRLINEKILLGWWRPINYLIWWRPLCSGTPCTCLNLALLNVVTKDSITKTLWETTFGGFFEKAICSTLANLEKPNHF